MGNEVLKYLDDPTMNDVTYLLREFLTKTPEEQAAFYESLWNKPDGNTVEEVLILDYMDKPLNPGKYGRAWMQFMEDEHKIRKTQLLTDGLWPATAQQVQDEALNMMETLREQYMNQNPRPTGDYMKTVHYEERLRTWAEEIVYSDIVYKSR